MFMFFPPFSLPYPSLRSLAKEERSTSGVWGKSRRGWRRGTSSCRRRMKFCGNASTASAMMIGTWRGSPAKNSTWSDPERLSIASPTPSQSEIGTNRSRAGFLNRSLHGNENHVGDLLDTKAPVNFSYADQFLRLTFRAQRHDQTPSFAQLLPQRLGNSRR